ncbi:hypothetical protein QBC35DRAFT_45752 [Podospora australis]|uniref:Nitrogen regulatory protein areA GATA-like domain-containing protein n=1 Tax=Podospora australis TaxID=1536484 RepID=A0AAN6X410_9PEZI|nr:hypothetical protein QBC35DRAFT_45752 [Podospora australis]
MPLSLDIPVLTVDKSSLHRVDTANPTNLFCMWTVFARCRDSVHQGRRLENLSWRLWNRETFCCENGEVYLSSSMTKPQNIRRASDDELPQLSGSVDSLADEEAVDFAQGSPVDIVRPRILRQDSCGSSRSRGRERHITSDELEKLVVEIMEAKVPLDAPLPVIPCSPAAEEKPCYPTRNSARTGSTTDEESSHEDSEPVSPTSQTSELEVVEEEAAGPIAVPMPMQQRQTIVTRGFSPSSVPACRITSQVSSSNVIPQPTEAPAPKIVQSKKQGARFALGGSSGSNSDGSYNSPDHMEMRKPVAPLGKSKMFQVGGSSDEDGSLKAPQHLSRTTSSMGGQKKTASFNQEVVTQTFESSAISDSEESESDYIDESAIDDDDEDWEEEESAEDSNRSSLEDNKLLFQRVDSTAQLPSRRSLISLALAHNGNTTSASTSGLSGLGRTQRLNNLGSNSTSAIARNRAALNGPAPIPAPSPNDSDEAPLMMKRGNNRAPPMRSINEVPRSAAQPIMATATGTGINYPGGLSPRTTRRNMLATELTESLRRNLLWERSQKSSTANAVLKRRHTSHDVANLKQYPQKPYMGKDAGKGKANENSLIPNGPEYSSYGYHTQGW